MVAGFRGANNSNIMYYFTASNNSTFMVGRRSAKTLRQATREALTYLRGELMGEGIASIYDSPTEDFPLLTFERTIHTGYRCVRTDAKGNKRTIRL